MSVKRFRETLLRIEDDQSAALQRLAALLQPIEELDLDDFAKAIEPAIKKRAATEARKREQREQSAAEKEALIASYLEELGATKSDNVAFENVVKRIETDRKLKAAEIEQIAQRFMATSATYRTKKAATKAILARQIADKRAGQRSSQVSGIF